MAMQRIKVGISTILDAWNAEVDIADYSVDADDRLVIVYCVDEMRTTRIEARWVAGWFGGRFVRWVDDSQGSLDGMVIEKEVAK